MKTKVFLALLITAALGTLFVFRVPIAKRVLEQSETRAVPPPEHAGHSIPVDAGEKGTPPAVRGRVLYWMDPMHPSYRSDKPGTAPDCGMQLEPVYEEEAAALGNKPEGTVRIPPERQQLIGVRWAKAELRPLSKTIRAAARITYDETRIAHVHSKVEGWIEQVFVNYTGARVQPGQALFTLYSPELLASQQEFLLALKARKQLSGAGRAEVSAGAESLYAAAKRRLELWDMSPEQISRLEQTGQALKTITVYSPHDGFVLERKAFEHQRVTADMEIYSIADLSRVWAVAEIYESEAALVRVGQFATLELESMPGRKLRGNVTFLSPELDAQTRTLRVRLDFPNPGFALRPQMFATAEIEVNFGRQLVIPAEAVLDSGTRQYVFVTEGDGFFIPREVKLGTRSEKYVAIVAGLKRGEAVVTSAGFLVDSESRLKAPAAQASGHQHPQ